MKLLNCMGDQAGTERTKPRPPSRLGKGRTSGSFTKGDPRINRSGRPRAGTAFSERGRERLDPDRVLDLAEKVLDDESIPARERLAIVMPVIDRIYVRPPTDHRLDVRTTNSEQSYGHLSDAEVEAELERLDRLALPESSETDGATPGVTDGDAE